MAVASTPADAGVDARQTGQDDAADRRQHQTDDMDPQIRQLFRARLVVLDHVQLVRRADVGDETFQRAQHGQSNPGSSVSFLENAPTG
jgi:hypothetical protein